MAIWEPISKSWPQFQAQGRLRGYGWMYTVDDTCHGLRTIGYCMSWEDRLQRSKADIARYGPGQQLYLNNCKKYKHIFHEMPHATKDEAVECYRDYLFDLHLLTTNYSTKKYKCDLCENPSSFSVNITGTSTQGNPIYFCDPHSTLESIKQGFYKVFWIDDVTNLGPVRPVSQDCICTSRILFNQGCQCGGS